jgi:hypothetical protein
MVLLSITGYQFLSKIGTGKPRVSSEPTPSEVTLTPIDNNSKIDDSIPETLMNADEYKEYLGSLNINDANSIQKGLEIFLKNQTGFSQSEKDQAFMNYCDFFYEVINTFGRVIYKGDISERMWDEVKGERVTVNVLLDFLNNPDIPKKDPQIQELTDLVYRNGMKFEMSEGTVYISDQPDFLHKNFGSYLSEAFQEYLAILKEEDAETYVDDACLLISFDDLGNRIIAWEDFMERYPEFEYSDSIQKRYSLYLKIFLRGLENSPIFSYPDYLLEPEIKKAYENFIQKNGDRESGRLVKDFFESLESEDFKKNDKVPQFYKDHHLEWSYEITMS